MSLQKQKKRQKQLNKYASLTALVFQMGATIYVCSYLGKTIDFKLGLEKDYFTTTFVMLGFLATFYILLKGAKKLNND